MGGRRIPPPGGIPGLPPGIPGGPPGMGGRIPPAIAGFPPGGIPGGLGGPPPGGPPPGEPPPRGGANRFGSLVPMGGPIEAGFDMPRMAGATPLPGGRCAPRRATPPLRGPPTRGRPIRGSPPRALVLRPRPLIPPPLLCCSFRTFFIPDSTVRWRAGLLPPDCADPPYDPGTGAFAGTPGGGVLLSFSNDGIGLSPQLRGHLTVPRDPRASYRRYIHLLVFGQLLDILG
jgi:hypothetical protein